MTKMFSKKFLTVLISCCCIGTGIVLACAGGDVDEYGVSNFTPEIFVDSAYSPFFYSDQFYYRINHDEDQHTRFNNNNIAEWSAFFKNQVSHDELQYLLQQATTASVDSAASCVSGKSTAIPVSLQSFAILKQKKNKQLSAFFAYLQLAKKSEVFALNDIPNFWDTDSTAKKTKTYNVTALNRDLQNAFSTSTDVFLKERYWFQLIRSYFFNSSAQQAIDLFNTMEKNMPHDNMYFRSMAYAAGAFYKLKNYSKANYYYSKVFDGCDELKTVAHYSFHPQEDKDWNATLALCSNNTEKATLWQMLGIFYTDEQRAIREIYQLNPSSNKLDLLLTRAVNKYEQKFNYQGSAFMYMPQVDTIAAATLPALVTKIATAGNTGKPWMWQMAAGYLNTLDEKYTAAANWFAKAEKTVPNQKSAQAQLRILKLINTIGRATRIDATLEKNVLPDIEWLSTFDNKSMPDLRYLDAFAWLKQKMAAKYRLQKQWVKAECFSSQSGFFTDDKNVEALKTLLSKTDKTPYEKLCAELCVMKVNDLFEFQAISLTYADSLDAAIEKMEKAGSAATVEFLGNPFNGKIQDCHDCDHAAPQKIKYTKLSLLKKLKEIKEKINAGDDVYNNAMLMANAYYNITYYGNARVLYDSKILGSGDSNDLDSTFKKMLTGMNMATKYYTLSLQKALTDEQRAKCQYMLAKCQRNQWYNESEGKNATAKEIDFIAWDGFKALKQYSSTQYYKDVIKECGYFKTYSGK